MSRSSLRVLERIRVLHFRFYVHEISNAVSACILGLESVYLFFWARPPYQGFEGVHDLDSADDFVLRGMILVCI